MATMIDPKSTRSYSEAYTLSIGQFVRTLSDEQAELILAATPDPVLSERIDLLSSKANEGTLSEPERNELTGYVDANDVVGILHGMLRQRLSGQQSVPSA